MMEAMDTSIKSINKIKGGHNALSHRKFLKFLEDTNAEFKDLLMYTQVRQLRRGKSLKRLFVLRNEVLGFLETNEPTEQQLINVLKSESYVSDLAFLSDFREFLNRPNVSLQGRNQNIKSLVEKTDKLEKHLYLLLQELKGNNINSFPRTNIYLNSTCPQHKLKEYISVVQSEIISFSKRFLDFVKIRPILQLHDDPLHCCIEEQTTVIQSELRELQEDERYSLDSGLDF